MSQARERERFLLLRGAVFGLTIIATTQAQTNIRRDGNWWRSQFSTPQSVEVGQLTKSVYIAGFLDGMDLGKLLTVLGAAKDSLAERERAFEYGSRSYAYHMERYKFGVVTAGQLVDGIDSFYSDYRNRSILLSNAVYVVAVQIAGDPDKEVERTITNLRKAAK